MKSIQLGLSIVAGVVALTGSAHAATVLVAGPTGTFLPGANYAYCQVLNTGSAPVEVIIEAQNDSGIAQKFKQVTLAPEQGTSLAGGNETSSCRFRSQSKRIVGMLIARDPATGTYINVIPARR